MADKGEKFLSFDKFKERVYKNIGTLEHLEEFPNEEFLKAEKNGCLGIFIPPLVGGLISKGNKMALKQMKIEELKAKADAILAQKEIKDLLCDKLDATVILPIDAAYKITPVLYGLALENEENVPFDSMLFAIISRKIVKEGVENFCRKTTAQAEKGGKGADKKPATE
jgi:hypothetical protein